jgi:non-ribosomal peptide synthetase component F
MLPGNTLHSIFEVRACESPDRVAVVCADEQITYGELNQRAEQLAGRLRSRLSLKSFCFRLPQMELFHFGFYSEY